MSITNAKLVGKDTDPRAYHAQLLRRGDPRFVMSRSELQTFASCPRKWIWGWRSEDTQSTEWGSLVDALVLGGAQWERLVELRPESYTSSEGVDKPWNGNSKTCRAWLAERKNRLVVTTGDVAQAKLAAKRLFNDEDIMHFIAGSDKQVMLRADWRDDKTGLVVLLKAMIDLVPLAEHAEFGKCLGDLKTTKSAVIRDYNKSVFYMGYHVQSALYLDLYCAATGEDRCDFRHIVSENRSPYEPGLRYMSSEYVELGRVTYKSQLAFYCRCLAEQRWPGYDDLETLERRLCGRWSVCQPESWMVQ